jgi:hypothetical protein
MKEIVERGAVGVLLHLFLPDADSAVGGGKTGVAATTPGLRLAVIRPGEAAPRRYAAELGNIDPIATLGQHAVPNGDRCAWGEIDPAWLPGWYELQLADAVFDTAGGGRRSVGGMVWGVTGLVPTPFQIQLSDPQRGVGSPQWLDATVSSRVEAGPWTAERAARLDSLDRLDVPVSSRGDARAATLETLLARLGAFSGLGSGTVLGCLRALCLQQPGLTPLELAGGYDNTRHSLEARASALVDAVLSPSERAALADAWLDRAGGVEAGETPRQTLRLLRAVCVGPTTGFPDGPLVFRDPGNTRDRVRAVVDVHGNRQQIETDPG